MVSGTDIYNQVRAAFKAAGLANPALEARYLVRHHTGLTDADLIARTTHPVAPETVKKIQQDRDRRLTGVPLSRIIGAREFWGLEFKLGPAVLDPRPDTEIIIEKALAAFPKPPERILDLGTGSGCILIALLSEWPLATGLGVDISPEALAIAQENAILNSVNERCEWRQGSWTEGVTGKFDLILSNPPYIPSGDIANLQTEVRNHDPIRALDGGKDGLDEYRRLAKEIKKLFHNKTRAFFEVGISQAQHVVRIVEEAGFEVVGVHEDLAGIPRVVEISIGEK